MSDTPKTDEAIECGGRGITASASTLMEVAREMERELTEVKRLLSEVEKNTNLRFHPELIGLHRLVVEAIQTRT